MNVDLNFDRHILATMIDGQSVIDMENLNIRSRDEARNFLMAYGYDIEKESDNSRLWSYHRRAITYIETQLLSPGQKIPVDLAEGVLLKDLCQLLLGASQAQDQERRFWCCAILRVMHVINHLSNDLFSAFSDDIQEQVIQQYQRHISYDPTGRAVLGRQSDQEQITLEKFDVKPFKTSNSAITKLLAKPEEVAFGLMDKMGIRFVTHSVFDCFRVLRWLVQHHVVSYPHLIPEQSINTLFPLNSFLEAMSVAQSSGIEQLDQIERVINSQLEKGDLKGELRERNNVFTSKDYRFIKFIVRSLIRTHPSGPDRPFMFYYPYEVQIMDRATFQKNSVGPASHSEYKSRQRQRAYERVFRGHI